MARILIVDDEPEIVARRSRTTSASRATRPCRPPTAARPLRGRDGGAGHRPARRDDAGHERLGRLPPAARRGSTMPVIMLTARGEEADRVIGLELGPTTTSPSRSARASCSRASTPCCGGQGRGRSSRISRSATCGCAAARQVHKAGREIKLTRKEFDLLRYLVEPTGDVSRRIASSTRSGATIGSRRPGRWTRTS